MGEEDSYNEDEKYILNQMYQTNEEVFYPKEGKLIQQSLLYQIGRDNNSFEYDYQNVFELELNQRKEEVEVNIKLAEIRMICSLLTLSQLIKLGISYERMFERLERQKQQTRQEKIKMFEKVLSNLGSSFESEEEKLLQNILSIEWFRTGMSIKSYQSQVKDGLIKQISSLDIEEEEKESFQNKGQNKTILTEEDFNDEQEILKEEFNIQIEEKQEMKKLIRDFIFRLKSISLWIPLNAQDAQSQVISLSLNSDFIYHRDLIHQIQSRENLSYKVVEQRDYSQATIDNLTVQNLIYVDRKNSINPQNLQDNILDYSGKYNFTNILAPTRIQIVSEMKIKNNEDHQESINKYDVQIANIKIIVGLQQIDIIYQQLVMVKKEIISQLREQERINKVEQVKQEASLYQCEVPSDVSNFELLLQKQAQQIQLNKYIKQNQIVPKHKVKASSKSEIIISFDKISFQLEEDSNFSENLLINFQIAQLKPLILNSFLVQDDAGSYILKKLGIFNTTSNLGNQDTLKYVKGGMNVNLNAEYYNQRTLSFEPLIEPWSFGIKLEQDYPQTELAINFKSECMFNINLTFGLVLSLKQIMDRIVQSKKSSLRLEKQLKQQKFNLDEEEEEKEFEQQLQLSNLKASLGRAIKQNVKDSQGYIFYNFSELTLKFTTNDYTLNEELELVQNKNELNKDYKPTLYELTEHLGSIMFIEHKELERINQIINVKNMISNKISEQFEEESLKIDLKINNLDKISGIPIEALGTYSFSTVSKRIILIHQEKPLIAQEVQQQISPEVKKGKGGLLGFGLVKKENFQLLKKKPNSEESKSESISKHQYKTLEHKIGVIIDIQVEGTHRKVNIESQLILANNLQIDVFLTSVGELNQKEFKMKLKPGSIFKVPLSWFISDPPTNIYISGENQEPQLLFKDIASIFSPSFQDSKLSQSHSQILNLQEGQNNQVRVSHFNLFEQYYASVDIQGYKCLPKNAENRPLRYIVSFNAPLMISNNNFSNLEIGEQYSKETYLYLQPKQLSSSNDILRQNIILTKLDPNQKYNLQWIFYNSDSASLELITEGYHLASRIGTTKSYAFQAIQDTEQNKQVNIELEVKKQFYQNFQKFEGLNENFQFKHRVLTFVSSVHLIIYPKFMIINKTPKNVQCVGSDSRDWQIIQPYSNQYFNNQGKKNQIRFKTDGYKESTKFDITTIGLSGCFELEKELVSMTISSAQDKAEYGIQIQVGEAPFNRTTMISIVPRFVLINNLNHPLVIKQKDLKKQVLVEGEQAAYNFESQMNKFIMVREKLPNETKMEGYEIVLHAEMAQDEQYWSTPFSIEDIDDFQISFPGEPAYSLQKAASHKNWYQPQESNNNMRFARVLITTQDNATILVIFSNPEQPEFEVKNNTLMPLQFAQVTNLKVKAQYKNPKTPQKRIINEDDYTIVGSGGGNQYQEVKAQSSVPYSCQDRNQPIKKIMIKIENSVEVINLDKSLKKRVSYSPTGNMYCVEIKVTSYGKILIVSKTSEDSIKKGEKTQAKYLQTLLKRNLGRQLKVNFKLKGAGISIIDQQPREIMFISLYKINIDLMRWYESRGEDVYGILENITQVDLNIKHLQVDNTLNFSMPILLAPSQVLTTKHKALILNKQSEEKKQEVTPNEYVMIDEDEELTPFIQLSLSFAKNLNKEVVNVTERLRSFQLAIQEFQVYLDTPLINNNIKILEELNDSIQALKPIKISQVNEPMHMASRQDYCAQLNPKLLTNFSENENLAQMANEKTFMEYIHLSAIKCIVSFSFEKELLEQDISQPIQHLLKGMNFIEGIVNSSSYIADSPFQFKELILLNTFISSEFLLSQLTKNLIRQGILQFYKHSGNSDMIGNQLGLVDKLGTGVFEFTSEPQKGFLSAPELYLTSEGVKTLVTSVVSGSFQSISKLSGSLYSVVKTAQGDKIVQFKKPDHVFDGIYQGFKGGLTELAGGVTGLITKPMEKTREEGARGTVKGIGQGLFGLVSAPVTASLRLGSSVASGVSSSVIYVGNIGKEKFQNNQYSRFRPPRYINIKGILHPYNMELSQVYSVLADLKGGKYAGGIVKYYCSIPETNSNGDLLNKQDNNALMIVTDQHLLYVTIDKEGKLTGKANISFKTTLHNIYKCILTLGKDNQFTLVQPVPQQKISKIRIIKRIKQNREQKKTGSLANYFNEIDEEFFCLEVYCRSLRLREAKRVHKFITFEYEKFQRIYEIISLQDLSILFIVFQSSSV